MIHRKYFFKQPQEVPLMFVYLFWLL